MTARLLVEFVGPPFAGKTTLSRAVAEKLSSAGNTVTEPAQRIASLPRPRRIAAKATLAMGYSLRNPLQSLAASRALLTSGQRRRSDIPSLVLNWLFVQAIHRTADADITLLDQGAFQACWSVGFRSRRDWEEIFDALPIHHTPDVVVFVRADEETLVERLQRERKSGTRVSATVEDVRRSIEGVTRLESHLDTRKDAPETIPVRNDGGTDIETVTSDVLQDLEQFI